MGVQVVKEGEFDFKPNKLLPYLGFDRVGFVTVFHENCNYVYPDQAQQGDWLKLGGVAFSLEALSERCSIWAFRSNG